MRPFQQFRVWARRAPLGERATAVAVAVLLVAGLTWLGVPSDEDGPEQLTAGAAGRGAAGAADAGGIGSVQADPAAGNEAVDGPVGDGGASTAATGADGTAVAAAGSTTSGGCTSPPGSDQGVTEGQIKLAILLVELAGATGNEALNVPPVPEQKAAYEAVLADLNANGGAACRKIVPQYFTINPLDQAQLQRTCLDVVEAKPFFVIDLGGYAAFPALADCYPRNQLPFYQGSYLPQGQIEGAHPYLFASGTLENQYFNGVFGLKEHGFFEPAKGFKKLGFMYQDCVADMPPKFIGWLERAGVPRSQIVTYSFGCPAAFNAPPTEVAQAVLRFQREGVTHVTLLRADSDWKTFSNVAEQQGYRPKYGFGDISTSFSIYGTSGPNWENIDGMLLVSSYRFNEERTPGFTPSAGTRRCQAILTARKQPDLTKQKLGMGGVACNQLWFFQSAANHAPELKRTALAEGLRRGGQIDFSFPHGPGTFPTAKSTYHGNFWRMQRANAACRCLQVIQPDFRPTFPGFR